MFEQTATLMRQQMGKISRPTRSRGAESSPIAEDVPRIYILASDMSANEPLKRLVHGAGWVLETFASAAEFLACQRPSIPSCLILDVGLPDDSALDVQERLASEGAAMPVIILASGNCDIRMMVRAMKAGALEVLMKPFSEESMLDAISQGLDCSRALLTERARIRMLEGCYDSLSTREREVMQLVVRGLRNKQVAGELGISEITVKVHRGNAMRKMQASSFAELVSMAATLHAPGHGGRIDSRVLSGTPIPANHRIAVSGHNFPSSASAFAFRSPTGRSDVGAPVSVAAIRP